jgi:hypothetical protein
MSVQDYLHEYAEESRHNEAVAYVTFLAGSIFFVGGFLSALSGSKEPSWFLLFPVSAFVQGLFLEVIFLGVGLFLIVAGLALGVHHNRDRSFYLEQLRAAHNQENLLRENRVQVVEPVQLVQAVAAHAPKRKKALKK